MKIVEPSFHIISMPEEEQCLALLEGAARTCYKSEDKIRLGSVNALLARIFTVELPKFRMLRLRCRAYRRTP